MIRLSQTAEPEIWAATNRFSTVLENVVYDEHTRDLDVDSEAKTENTRSAYPLEFIPNVVPGSKGPNPNTIIMLTADAFGVLPPISKLTRQQAMYHFLSGYTAKVAGTERGVTEPTATFSTCFGAPFMVHHPTVYAKLLGKKIDEHEVECWLVNTGWNGGPYGVGKRMSIAHTRAMVNAAIEGTIPREFDPSHSSACGFPRACRAFPTRFSIRATRGPTRRVRRAGKQTRDVVLRELQALRTARPDAVKAVAIRPLARS